MAVDFKTNSKLHDHLLKQQRLIFDVTIGSSATAANKTHSTDLPGVAYLRTEGKTATADAVEDASAKFDTASDSSGKFGVLLDVPNAKKVYKVRLTEGSNTTALGTNGATVTSGKRIALDLDSDQNLTSQDITVTIEVDYLEE